MRDVDSLGVEKMFTCFSSSILLTTSFTIAIVSTGEWIRREILRIFGLECSCDRCLTFIMVGRW